MWRVDPLFTVLVLQGEARAYNSLGDCSKALDLSEEVLERDPQAFGAMLSFITVVWILV